MGFLSSFDISSSGLTAQRLRMDVIAQNIANQSVTRGADGQPYKRRYTVLGQNEPSFSDIFHQNMDTGSKGVRVTAILEDNSSYNLVYDPEHPDAQDDGYVRTPNVDIAREIVDMMAAVRSYEANITVINSLKNMAVKALEIGR